MPIKDNTEAHEILKNLDRQALANDLNLWINEKFSNKLQHPADREKALLEISPSIEKKYGFDIWDAMLLLNLGQEDHNNSDDFLDWRNIYNHIDKITQAAQLSPHLQDDFNGTNEFLIWCNPKDFDLIEKLINESTPKTQSTFFIVIEEIEDHKPSGRKVQIQTNR